MLMLALTRVPGWTRGRRRGTYVFAIDGETVAKVVGDCFARCRNTCKAQGWQDG